MTCDHIHFITFDCSFEHDVRLTGNDAAPQNRGHLLSLGLLHFQFLGDLGVRQIQSHEVQAKHPVPQGAVVPGEYGLRQIVECLIAHSTEVSLTFRLGFIVSVFGDLRRMAMGTFDTFGPTKAAYHFVTFGIVDQSLNVQSHPA
jgi:hypothetical protein